MAWNSGDDFEREFIISIATGPNWFQFMIPVFVYGILPLTMLFAKLRQTIFSSFIIVIFWFASYFMVAYLSHVTIRFDFLSAEYAEKAALFIGLLAVLYFIISRRKKM